MIVVMLRLAFAFASALTLAACTSTSYPSSTPDASNGVSQDGGPTVDGTSPTDAQVVEWDGGDQCYPTCLAALLASCKPEGACTQQAQSQLAGNTCFANGVKIASVLESNGNGVLDHEILTYSKNGQPCFTEDYRGIGATPTKSGTGAITTYTAPDGTVVAIENDDFTGTFPAATVTCGGVTYRIHPMSTACMGPAPSPDADAGDCASGNCP
jgi:hypothetical protein